MAKAPSKGEMAQWNKQYLRCAAEMSQWETMAEYASVTENYGQLTDCLWRMHEWQRLKELVLPKTMVEETPVFKMVQTYVHLQDGHVIEADKHTGAAISKALEQYAPALSPPALEYLAPAEPCARQCRAYWQRCL